MPQAVHETINLGDFTEARPGIDGDPPRQEQAQRSQEESVPEFRDSSEPLFSMYLKLAEEDDKRIAEHWRADAGGILVFTGLFSASVAAFVVVSVQDLRPNPQDATVFYLDNIFQLLASSNASLSGATIPSASIKPPPFIPPGTAVWVNSLWFLSFSMSLTCALLATLQLQWAHRYITVTRSHHSPHTRARISVYFGEALQRLRLPWMIEWLPTLLHLSLFFFFAGLIVYLYNINLSVYNAIIWWIWSCVSIYIYVTLMPLFWHNSPYSTPFSSTAWFIYTCTLCIFHQTLKSITASNRFSHATHHRFCVLKDKYKKWLIHGIPAAIEESAQDRSPELDHRTFLRTFEASDEDDKLEQFFACIPGFCGSKVVVDPLGLSIQPNRERLSVELMGLICRTLSSTVVSDSVKIRRMTVCAEAMEAASLPISRAIFDALHQRGDWQGLLSSVDFGLFLRKADRTDRETAYYSQLLISAIIANAQKRDARWFALVTGHLGIPESVLSRYLYHGDSALLANCIHVLRCIVRNHSHCFIGPESLIATLKSVSKLAVQDTLPELQHEFCALWNQAVFGMCNNEDPVIQRTFLAVLSHVRHLFSSLHHGARAFSASAADHDDILRRRSSYPTCDIPAHYRHPDSAFRIPEVVVGETVNASPASSLMFACGDPSPTTTTATSSGADKPLFLLPNVGYAGAFPADSALPGNLSATMPHFSLVAVLPHLAPHYPATVSVDAANPVIHGTVHPPVFSYMASPVPYIPPIGHHAPSLTGGTANPPPFNLPGALSSPTLIPAPGRAHSDRFGDISYGLTSMSSATTSSWAPAAPQDTSVLGPDVISGYGTPNTHDDAGNMNLPIQVETSHGPYPSEKPTPEILSEISRPASRNSCRASANFPHDIKKS